MMQAFEENGILGAVLPSALHIPCLLHQLELVMELWPDRLGKLVAALHILEDMYFRHVALHHCYERFLQKQKLSLPVPNSQTGPEAWLKKAMGVKEHILILEEFLATEEGATEEGAISKLQTLLAEGNADLMAEATFVAEHAAGLLNVAQFLR